MAVARAGMRKAVEFEGRVSSRQRHYLCQALGSSEQNIDIFSLPYQSIPMVALIHLTYH